MWISVQNCMRGSVYLKEVACISFGILKRSGLNAAVISN